MEEARRRREYEQSPEYLWLQRGYVLVVEREFPVGFARSMPTLWDRLTGNAPQTWLGVEIIGRGGYKGRGEPPWRTTLVGFTGSKVHVSQDFAKYANARRYADNLVHATKPANVQITLSIETELLVQPSIPQGYRLFRE